MIHRFQWLMCAMRLHRWTKWEEFDQQHPVPDNPLKYRQKYRRHCKCCPTRQVRIHRIFETCPVIYTIKDGDDDKTS